MEITVLISSIISVIFGAVGGFFASHLSEKGKNFATKGDIGEITDNQARVQIQYDAKLETLRSELERQAHAGKLAFEREFGILQDLWKRLDDLQQSTKQLLGTPPSVGTEKAQEKQLVEEFVNRYSDLYEIVRKNCPFYAKEIYNALGKILDTTLSGSQYYRTRNVLDMPTREERWKDIGTIDNLIDAACEKIRERLFHHTGEQTYNANVELR